MVDSLLDLPHKGKVIFRMSVNPQRLISRIELGTSSLEKRIEAVNRMCEAGYPCGLLIAPVMLVDGWKAMYTELLEQLRDGLTEKAQKQTTVIAATGGNPKPFTFEEDGKLTGHNIELLKAVFDRLPQYKLELTKVEFPSMFSGLSSGRYQIAVNNLAKNEEREKNYQFSDPIFKNSYVVIFKKGNSKAKEASTWTDLAGLSTVGPAGINSTTAIEEYNKSNPDKEITLNYSSEDLKSQLQGVESGKYDFLVMDKPMFAYYQKEYDLDLVGKDISGSLSN